MSEVVTVTRTLEEAVVDLGAGRCLRVRLIRGTDEEPDELYISDGWLSGGEDRRRSIGPLPGRAIAGLREALETLEGEPDR